MLRPTGRTAGYEALVTRRIGRLCFWVSWLIVIAAAGALIGRLWEPAAGLWVALGIAGLSLIFFLGGAVGGVIVGGLVLVPVAVVAIAARGPASGYALAVWLLTLVGTTAAVVMLLLVCPLLYWLVDSRSRSSPQVR